MTHTVRTNTDTYEVKVNSLLVVKPNSCADNPDDYHGFTEMDFDVLDGEGNDITNSVSSDEQEEIYDRVLILELAAAEEDV